ncbi:MAG: hypothetical protein JST22_18750 [Bacteroidetes bacterium]|nr:hypothetical protein [Bacteroidota bacterium]
MLLNNLSVDSDRSYHRWAGGMALLSVLIVAVCSYGCSDRRNTGTRKGDSVRAGSAVATDSAHRLAGGSVGASVAHGGTADPGTPGGDTQAGGRLDACEALKRLPDLLSTIAEAPTSLEGSTNTVCLRVLIGRLADSAIGTGNDGYYDAFAAIASIAEGEIRPCYDSACARLFHRVPVATMKYLYGRSMGRFSTLVAHVRYALAVEIDHAHDSAAAWRAFDKALNEYAHSDTARALMLNASLLRAGVLKQLAADRQ